MDSYDTSLREVLHSKARVSNILDKIQTRRTALLHSQQDFREESKKRTYLREMRELSMIQEALDVVEASLISVSERMDTLKIVYKGLRGLNSVTSGLVNLMGDTPLDPAGIRVLVDKLLQSSKDALNDLTLPTRTISFDLNSSDAQTLLDQCHEWIGGDPESKSAEMPAVPWQALISEEDGETMIAADGGFVTEED